MIGHPKYNLGDTVTFSIVDELHKEHILSGEIAIVDAYGTFGQNEDVSYDILVEESHFNGEPCLYKHIVEGKIK